MSYADQQSKRRYANWRNMIDRCYDPKNPNYKNYGGRGIRVCDSWHDRKVFYKYLESKPAGTTLDRIDNNGNYEPDNCRWASSKAQALNRRSNKWVTIEGITKSLYEWAEYYGINGTTVSQRINAYGWPVEVALTKRAKRNV